MLGNRGKGAQGDDTRRPAAAGAAKRPFSGTAAGGAKRAPAGGGRTGSGDRGARGEGAPARERSFGERSERRPSTDRPPRREGAGSAPRSSEGTRDRGERPPRRTDSERAGGERAPRRFDNDRAPRPFEGTRERSDRPPRRAEGDRAPREEGARRPYSGARSADDARRPFSPRSDRPDTGAPRGDRPARRERDESRDRSDTARPKFGADRGAPGTRRGAERPALAGDRPAFSRERGSDDRGARGERTFAKPVKSAYADRAERPARDARSPAAPAKRGFGDRAERGPRSDRTDRPASPRTPRQGESAGGNARAFTDRERPARDDRPPRRAPSEIAKPERAPKAASHVSEHEHEHEDQPGALRLSKRMSELGLCSRREADEWIEKGWVLVDGVRIDTLGTKVLPDKRIEIDPAAQAAQAKQVTILLHKPVGFVSRQAEDGYLPAVTLITPENHWDGDHSNIRFSPTQLRALAPAGRLDIDSTGMLVLTQDGRVAKQLIGEHSDVDKEYLVRVKWGDQTTDIDQSFPAENLAQLRFGLSLDDVPLKPAMVSWQNGEQLRFVLREGKKRQIRRMCELVGLEVVGLKRVRMGRVLLGALPQGQWRYLDADESF
jgi:23S rRNA pseudouridine2604 synthase